MADTWYTHSEIKCIYYRHGAESEEEEISLLPPDVEVRDVAWLNDTCKPQAKLDDPMGGPIYIPGRNLVFATLAACQELPDEIWMGTLYDECNDTATDKNNKFRADASALFSYVLSPFKKDVMIRFPFVEQEMTKDRSVKWALKNGLTPRQLKQTVSCWHYSTEDNKACGACKQCFKRFFVMLMNGIREDNMNIHPVKYLNSRYIKYYLNKEDPNADEANVRDMILHCKYHGLLTQEELGWIHKWS